MNTDDVTSNELESLRAENSMMAELQRLREENLKLKASKKASVSLKVTEKGGVSFYGLGRYPTTLYKEQWNLLLDHVDEIREFLAANDDRLAVKG